MYVKYGIMNMDGVGDIFNKVDTREEAIQIAKESCKRNRSIYWVVKITHTDTLTPVAVPVKHERVGD